MTSDRHTLLVIPLESPCRTALAAAGSFRDVPASFLVRFAQTFRRGLSDQQLIKMLLHENDSFLRQVTNDFEEMTFLRSMAELLEVSDLTFDFTAMAEQVLPTLLPVLEADALILVAAERPTDPHKPGPSKVAGPRLWEGLRNADEDTCISLVQQFKEASATQPVVKNRFQMTPDGIQYSGIDSFILVPIVNKSVTIGWLLAINRNNERHLYSGEISWEASCLEFGTHEATLMSSSAAILATHSRNVELFREREQLLVSVVRALVSAVEAKDEYTSGHSERVALFAKRLGEELGLGEDHCEKIYLAGLLHDVGKIGVRDAVLGKPGRLDDDEYEEIKQHPEMGWGILSDIDPLGYVLPGVLFHHECFDGRGYPDSLKGDGIPVDGRILAVADAFDAMTSDRPYRKSLPQEKAEAILRSGAGQQWDPEVVAVLLRVMPEILQIRDSYQPRVQARRHPGEVTPVPKD